METAVLEGTLVSLMIGIGLSAACGFRIFVPFLVMNLAARAGYLELAGGWEWIGSTPALIAFGAATSLEIGAYYVPFLDNLLDTVSTPSAVVAGVLVTASQVSEMHPFFGWAVAIIAGGGASGLVQGLTTITRQVSSFATGGFGNPIFSTFEAGGLDLHDPAGDLRSADGGRRDAPAGLLRPAQVQPATSKKDRNRGHDRLIAHPPIAIRRTRPQRTRPQRT